MRVIRFVAVASQTGRYGGPFVTAMRQASLLRSDGLDVVVRAGAFKDDAPKAAHLLTSRVRHLVQSRSFVDVGSWRLLRDLASALPHADLIHVSFARELGPILAAGLSLLFRRPLILQPHGMLTTSTRGVFQRVVDLLVARPISRRATSLIALTEIERDQLVEWCPALVDRIAVVGNPPPEGPHAADPAVDVVADALFAARLHPRKHVLDFAHAAEAARDAGWADRYVAFGPDEGDLALLNDVVSRTPNLVYAGVTDDVGILRALRRSRVFVLPSEGEPWGNVLVAALSFGIPVVVTESSALAPLINVYGAGRVVPDSDPASIASAVHGLIQGGVYEEVGRNARALAADHLSADRVREALVRIYEKSTGSSTAEPTVVVLGVHPLHGHSMNRYASLLAEGYRSAGVDVKVVVPRAPLSPRLKSGGLQKLAVYAENLVLFSFQMLSSDVRRSVVHLADHSDAIWLSFPWRPRRAIVTCHDLIAVRAAIGELPEHRTRWSGVLYQALVTRGLRNALRVLAVSEVTSRDVRRLIPHVETAVLHNPLAPSMEPRDLGSRASAGVYLMVVSSVGWRKRREHAIEVWTKLACASSERLDLVLVGPRLTEAEADLAALVANGEVRVVDRVSDDGLRALYSDAVAVVQVSRYEGFGWPVIEANIHGTLAVCADLPVLREIGPANVFIPDDLEVVDWAQIWKTLGDVTAKDAVRENAQTFTLPHFAATLRRHFLEVTARNV